MFDYPDAPHRRRHGPRGYKDYKQYKPWLRDEFDFRCVYCLGREKWESNGHASFGVEHFRSRSTAPELHTRYENLLYACNDCNADKQAGEPELDPCGDSFRQHLEVTPDGTVRGLTPQGRAQIELCNLNRPHLVTRRAWLLRAYALVSSNNPVRATPELRLLRELFDYPSDLPDLTQCKPPGGNAKPQGARDCYYHRRRRGELAAVY